MRLYRHTPLAEADPAAQIREYHQRTKHSLDAYAAGPISLDWGDQPEAFRWFAGAPGLDLPLLEAQGGPSYAALFDPVAGPAPFDLAGVGRLFELALGLAAWKSYGPDRWALRCNPSSGNLHPTEGYLVTPPLPGVEPGLYHYLSRDHRLERRCGLSEEQGEWLGELLAGDGVLVGLSAIAWREAWKYGERAYRYCQLDAGHAFASLAVAAATLGWRVEQLDGVGDAAIGALLGLDRSAEFAGAEGEEPDMLLRVSRLPQPSLELEAVTKLIAEGQWAGQANDLRAEHYCDWPLVAEAAKAAHKPVTAPLEKTASSWPALLSGETGVAAAKVILGRRSAQAFDGVSSMSAPRLFRLLDTLLPRDEVMPWRGWRGPARVHPLLFVHRVGGLRPGIYLLARSAEGEALLREELRGDFAWERVKEAPGHLPFYRLQEGDARQAAATLACHQPIAANGAFAVAMLTEFEAGLAPGAWGYRRLLWEAGVIGQLMYLEATAAGLSGTGIGCFFDDTVHELLGIEGTRLQSLYHFTVGKASPDGRIETLSPWHHLPAGRR